jgi:tRNA(Leu) C34 or U34 (ribose-2'-O)-methylase TrmL
MSPARGYFGIGAVLLKTEVNFGTMVRTAEAFGAAFCFTVGRRYKHQTSDTTKSCRHLPIFHYADLDEFWRHIPFDCVPVAVEVGGAKLLPHLAHPRSAVYLLGPEDGNLPKEILERAPITVSIPAARCLNVATAASIVMYDRIAKC